MDGDGPGGLAYIPDSTHRASAACRHCRPCLPPGATQTLTPLENVLPNEALQPRLAARFLHKSLGHLGISNIVEHHDQAYYLNTLYTSLENVLPNKALQPCLAARFLHWN